MTPYLKDLVERVVKTFLQVFIATVVASGLDLTHALTQVSMLEKAGVAGLGAVAALIFAIVGKWVASPNNAAWTSTTS